MNLYLNIDRMNEDDCFSCNGRESIPNIFSKSIIKAIQEDLSFFDKDLHRTFTVELNPPFSYFSPKKPFEYQASNEDQEQLEQILMLDSHLIINHLSKNPNLCYTACRSITANNLIEFYSKDCYNEFVSLTLFGQSAELLKFLLLKVNPPRPPLWPKPRFSRAIPWFLGSYKMPFFFPSRKNQLFLCKSPILFNELAHFSSFTASYSQVIFGRNDGTIFIEQYPSKHQNVDSNLHNFSINFSLLSDKPYSLAWASDALWAFTETNAYCIDLATAGISVIKNHPGNLFPVVSDGFYFYNLSNRIVTVFTFVRSKFQLIKKVRLERITEKNVPFITNGLFITLAEYDENDQRVFRQFSLVSGSLIWEVPSDFQDENFSFSISPFKQNHIVLSKSQFLIYKKNFPIPRWILGIQFLENHSPDFSTLFEAVYFALYHDKDVFETETFDVISSLVTSYIQANNVYGIYLSLMLLCRVRDRKRIKALEDYFSNAKGSIRKYICYYFLLCLETNAKDTNIKDDSKKIHANQENEPKNNENKFKNHKKKHPKCVNHNEILLPNIINTFIEVDYPPTFIWLFPQYFDFYKIHLSNKAIVKLITYVTGNSNNFPEESLFIMLSFLNYAFSNIENNVEKFISPINAITISIEQRILTLSSKKELSSYFVRNSIDCKVWQKLLLLVYQHKSSWKILANPLVKFFDFGLWNNVNFCPELNRILNCTLYIFLSLFSSVSFSTQQQHFDKLDKFYKAFPNPLNGIYSSIDHKIFKLISRCGDIPSSDLFAYYFFKIRDFCIFESSQTLKQLNTLQNRQFSIKGVIKFLLKNDPRHLIVLQNSSLVEWFLQLFEARKLNVSQQCIFSMFLDDFNRISHHFINASKKIPLENFLRNFPYPFLFPPEMILQSNLKFSTNDITSMPLNLLRLSYTNIIKCYTKIRESTLIMLSLLNRLSLYDNPAKAIFFHPDSEEHMYNDLLLWTIGFKCGEIIDFRNYLPYLVNVFRNGSLRQIKITMKWILTAVDFHEFPVEKLLHEALNVVGEYLLDLENPFRFQNDPFYVAESIFVIIHYCRKMFNIKSDIFRNTLLHHINQNDKRTILTAFAIMNNSIEIPRPKANIHLLTNDFCEINGRIVNCDEFSIQIVNNTPANSRFNNLLINNKNNITLKISDCIQIWALPKPVKLHLINDFSFFQHLFLHAHFEKEYQNVFKLASLNAFLKLEKFKTILTKEFSEMIFLKEWPKYFMMDKSFYDFTYFMSISFNSKNPFLFQNEDELNHDFINSSRNDDSTVKEINLLESSGMMITTDSPTIYRSTPIHPNLKSTLNLNSSSNFSLEIYGFTDFNNYTLKYGPTLLPENQEITIENDPLKSLIILKMDQNNKNCNHFINYPPVKLFLIKIYLDAGTLCTYKFTVNPQLYDFHLDLSNRIIKSENENDESIIVERMHYIDFFDELPTSDSFYFVQATLQKSSQNLISTLKQLNALEIMNVLPADAILNLLYDSNPFVLDTSLSLEKMRAFPLWMIDSISLRRILSLQIVRKRLPEIFNEITKRKLSPNIHCNNQNYLCVDENFEIPLRNCFIINEYSYQCFDYKEQYVKIDKNSKVVPFFMVHSTILELIVNCRHLMMMHRFLGLTEFNKSFFGGFPDYFFKEVTKMAELVFPTIPPEGEKPDFPEECFFVEESIVHDFPNVFFLHKFFELTSQPLPRQTFICTQYPMYLTNVTKNSHFKINSKEFFSNQFVILYDESEQLPLTAYSVSVNRRFQVECDDSAMFVFERMPDFNLIDSEFKTWKPHHSLQLIFSLTELVETQTENSANSSTRSETFSNNNNGIFLAINENNKEPIRFNAFYDISESSERKFTKEIYSCLPLSTQFSYETSLFMLELLKTQKETINKLMDEILVKAQKNDICLSIEQYKDMRSFLFHLKERNKFLRKHYFSNFEAFEHYLIHISSQYENNLKIAKSIKENPPSCFLTKNVNSLLLKWLHQFIFNSPVFVVMLFLELCTGTIKLCKIPIYVISSNKEECFEILSKEKLIILGNFPNDKSFFLKILTLIQQYQNQFYV
ncbi:hypothetical protein TRFO_08013 [Tritrichomonas foetus]|uniref:Uncharacterized protein n=1 Tax=Tritrichomonas foetus TaxID=1144522 RepID=A0A1J4JS37_9EUKA|nr:hypothetical protein TRFO_08013 [Tritrichomonas foetus]|eukprot:OHT00342.1 hypothetical protein TRFO_08013 [Tritrichomonas foetus]